ncbi:MAG: substrate-binding domain-containing protein [Spirochaetaceae bacterium]|nr:substrate-binding domain-containing protein [Spirochaetaceae bacterium]
MRNGTAYAMIAAAALAAGAAALAFRGEAARKPDVARVVAIFKTSSAANAFWAAVRGGVESGAKDFGMEVEFRAPRDEIYVDEQIEILRGAIAEKPDAIVLAAGDYRRLIDPVREAKAAGIPVVLVDSFIETEDADARVGTDNDEAGRKCGAALLRRVSSGAKVAIMSYVKGSSTAIGRETGLRQALGSSVAIAATTYSSSEEGRAYDQARELIAGIPDLAGIAALNLPTSLGAARALEESGKADNIVLVGFDASLDIVAFIERGIIKDAIAQKPFNMGYLSMKAVRGILSGPRPLAYLNTGSVDVNQDNMFDPEIQKLLFPVAAER